MTKLSRLTALVSLALAAACSTAPVSSSSPIAVGSVEAAITSVPPSVFCVQITAAGAKTTANNFDVTPGQSATLTIANLAIGTTTFSALAFANPCSFINGTQPTWASAPATATVLPGQSVSIGLKLVQVGSAAVSIDFDDAGAPADLAVPPDLAQACKPVNGTCKVNADCCPGSTCQTLLGLFICL